MSYVDNKRRVVSNVCFRSVRHNRVWVTSCIGKRPTIVIRRRKEDFHGNPFINLLKNYGSVSAVPLLVLRYLVDRRFQRRKRPSLNAKLL